MYFEREYAREAIPPDAYWILPLGAELVSARSQSFISSFETWVCPNAQEWGSLLSALLKVFFGDILCWQREEVWVHYFTSRSTGWPSHHSEGVEVWRLRPWVLRWDIVRRTHRGVSLRSHLRGHSSCNLSSCSVEMNMLTVVRVVRCVVFFSICACDSEELLVGVWKYG